MKIGHYIHYYGVVRWLSGRASDQNNVYGAVIMAEPLREFTRFI